MTCPSIEIPTERSELALRASRRPWRLAAPLSAFALSAWFMVVYNGCNWLASRRPHVGTWYFAWERVIPFVPAMIVPYMSIDLFFFASPFLCRDRGELRTHAKRILLAVSAAGACFVLFPLRMGTTRPAVGGFYGLLFDFLGGFDRPYNLVPSLHVALLAILWDLYSRHTRRSFRLLVQGWFALIFASTLLTAQHHVVDLIAGLALGLLCLHVRPDRAALPPTADAGNSS